MNCCTVTTIEAEESLRRNRAAAFCEKEGVSNVGGPHPGGLGEAQVGGVVSGGQDEEVRNAQRPRDVHKVPQLILPRLLLHQQTMSMRPASENTLSNGPVR